MANDRKRRPSSAALSLGAHFERELDLSDGNSDIDVETYGLPWPSTTSKRVKRTKLSHVAIPGPAFPRSVYENYVPPLPPVREVDALQSLVAAFDQTYSRGDRPNYTCFQLEDFSIYRPDCNGHSGDLATLDSLQVRRGLDELVFDGMLSFGEQRFYVQGVHFKTLTVDGYGAPSVAAVEGRLCIQSQLAASHEVWYQLDKPSSVYQRFYRPFKWLTLFTHHFIGYLLVTNDVTLADFRSNFFNWLESRYSGEESHKQWHAECKALQDFRTTVVANVGFLRKECYGIDDAETGLCRHPIWDATLPLELRGIRERPAQEPNTTVTPFVYDCFKRMYFREHLHPRTVSNPVIFTQLAAKKERLGLTPPSTPISPSDPKMLTPRHSEDVEEVGSTIAAGDVVRVNGESGGRWSSQSSKWYVYVQAVGPRDGDTVLDVIWLYAPRDTTLGSANYPFENELFLSDHCECGHDAISIESVIGKVPVAWFAKDPRSVAGLCVRQKYRTKHEEDTYDFTSLSESDFRCGCQDAVPEFERCRRTYEIGDTVLAKLPDRITREIVLEPAQVTDFDLDHEVVLLRRLPKKPFNSETRPNELLVTDEVYSRPPSHIVRKIDIRFFRPEIVEKHLPKPYDRDGTGDFYFISGSSNENIEPQDDVRAGTHDETESTGSRCSLFPPLKQGLSPVDLESSQKLRGMGIFCGGGNFDRGLADGGAIDFRYAVDFDRQAIYSYSANVKENDRTKLFFGSVNDYLALAMRGSKDEAIAQPGDVDFLSGGSPCPGFSLMQNNKQSERSLRNCSLVASYVSFVDFFCPSYCILENVPSMTQGHGPDKSENVFAHVLAALVGMGYQVQQFLMDTWSYRSPQARTRVFIVASAPGLNPLQRPPLTHGQPMSKRFIPKTLGHLSNGLSFGKRVEHHTPFEHVSPSIATADLPNITESLPQLCPAFPDHKLIVVDTTRIRNRYAAIPNYPIGMGLVKTAKKGLLKGEPLETYMKRNERHGSAYTRMDPDGLFPTIMTKLSPWCYKSGHCLHWSENRPLTVMEMRRAQGFLDHEVIIGSTSDQVRIIGNSVERNVSFVLGLALRQAWESSKEDARSRTRGDTPFTIEDEDDHDRDGHFDVTAQLQTPDTSEDEQMGGTEVSQRK